MRFILNSLDASNQKIIRVEQLQEYLKLYTTVRQVNPSFYNDFLDLCEAVLHVLCLCARPHIILTRSWVVNFKTNNTTHTRQEQTDPSQVVASEVILRINQFAFPLAQERRVSSRPL